MGHCAAARRGTRVRVDGQRFANKPRCLNTAASASLFVASWLWNQVSHPGKTASIANLKRNRVIWESCAKGASAYILPKGQCPPAEIKLEVRT